MNKSGTTHRAGPDRRLQGSPIIAKSPGGGKHVVGGSPIVAGPIVRAPGTHNVTGGNTGGNGNGNGSGNKNKPQVCHCKQDEHEERYGQNAMKCRCVKNKSRGHTGNGGIPAWEEQLLTDIMGMMGQGSNPFGTTSGSGITTPDAYTSADPYATQDQTPPQQQTSSSPVALLLIAAGAGIGIWWYIRHTEKKPKKHEEKAA